MRKVVASLFISLDGVTEAPDQWQFDFDGEMAADMAAQIAAEDAVLLGRVTYQEWVSYWPTATDEPYASHIKRGSLVPATWSPLTTGIGHSAGGASRPG